MQTAGSKVAAQGFAASAKAALSNPTVLIALAIVAVVLIAFLIIVGVLLSEQINNHNNEGNTYSYSEHSNTEFWWPIGGLETEKYNGDLIAAGTPSITSISSPYGMRWHPVSGGYKKHNGIDIPGGGLNNHHNIIASRSGTVIRAVHDYGGGYGNHVIIDHGDNIYTMYAHMAQDSITVAVGDYVVQGQVIGKMGTTGSSTGVHLHFEIRVGGNSSAYTVDPVDPENPYISATNPRPAYAPNSTGISLTKTSLSKNEFVKKLEDYSETLSGNTKTNFDNNFLNEAETIYETSLENNMNPELIISFAHEETDEYEECGTYNYWGYGMSNEKKQCSEATQFDSIEDGIIAVASLYESYTNPNSSNGKQILAKAKEREAAGCDPGGYGPADTLTGYMSQYNGLGTYLVGPEYSTWGSGGCIYIEYWVNTNWMPEKYDEDYYEDRCMDNTCASPNGGEGCGLTETCELSDYTKFSVERRTQTVNEIFGY